MSKKRLHIEIDYDFQCFGLSCHQKGYRLAWHINNCLDTKLTMTNAIEIKEPLFQEEMRFSRFIDHNESTGMSYTLIGNRNKWGFLIPEEANIDYFLLVSAERYSEEFLLNELKSIGIILSAAKISVEKLKSKERLLY